MSNLNLISNSKYLKVLKFILFLFPIFLISGPFLPDLTISILFLFFFFIIIKKINYDLQIKKIFYFFLFFYFYILINSFFSFNLIIFFKSSIPYLRFIFFSFFLALLLIQFKSFFKIILVSLITCYLVLLIDSVFQVATGYNFFGLKADAQRISSLFGEKLVMGSFISRTLPITLSIFFFTKFKYQNMVMLFIVLIGGILVYLSAERLALVYYFCTLFFFIIFQFLKKKISITLLLFLLLSLVLYHIKPNSFERLYFHTIKQFKDTNNFGLSYRHELHFITAYNLFNDSKLLGHGLKSFRNLCANEKYAPTKKIINDNIVYSQVEGTIFFYKKFQEKNIFFILEKNYDNNKFLKILEEEILNDSFEFKKFYEGIYAYNLYKFFSKLYVNHNDTIRIGDPIGHSYEFADGCNTHPHNLYFEFLSELGLIGLFFLLIGFFYLLLYFIKVLNKIFLKKHVNFYFSFLFSLLGVILSLFPLFPSGSFFNNWLSSILYFNFAIVISFILIKKKQ